MKPLTIKTAKPRNPLVAPCLRRLAGAHRRGESSQRQNAARRLRDELTHLHPPSR